MFHKLLNQYSFHNFWRVMLHIWQVQMIFVTENLLGIVPHVMIILLTHIVKP